MFLLGTKLKNNINHRYNSGLQAGVVLWGKVTLTLETQVNFLNLQNADGAGLEIAEGGRINFLS
ncbi:MAG TPA: hypothetical protein VMO20_08230 [Candidatus Acidoferrum sp.]|nr:hypothetical protein [Candidatus Acidoferrum sp.]